MSCISATDSGYSGVSIDDDDNKYGNTAVVMVDDGNTGIVFEDDDNIYGNTEVSV